MSFEKIIALPEGGDSGHEFARKINDNFNKTIGTEIVQLDMAVLFAKSLTTAYTEIEIYMSQDYSCPVPSGKSDGFWYGGTTLGTVPEEYLPNGQGTGMNSLRFLSAPYTAMGASQESLGDELYFQTRFLVSGRLQILLYGRGSTTKTAICPRGTLVMKYLIFN